MVETVTTIDKAGRVVIPKEIRDKMGLKEDSAILVADSDRGVMILKRLDIEELARSLKQELRGKDVDSIARRIEEGSNARARKEHRSVRS